MRSFEDPMRAVRVALEEAFTVTLAGNPTTGYTWQADVDPRYLELLTQEFELVSETVGAGGQEVFRFRALEAGETEIAFEYRRPWGGKARDAKHFQVVIT